MTRNGLSYTKRSGAPQDNFLSRKTGGSGVAQRFEHGGQWSENFMVLVVWKRGEGHKFPGDPIPLWMGSGIR